MKARYFNPRPRKEGDVLQSILFKFGRFISIHALVKRATSARNTRKAGKRNFNPRPRKEGDGLADSSNGSKGDFNPRPRKEGD